MKHRTAGADYQALAVEFSVGDVVVPYGASRDYSGRVVSVWPAIGMLDVEFPAGTKRYPVEDVLRLDDAGNPDPPSDGYVPGGLGTVSVPGGPFETREAGDRTRQGRADGHNTNPPGDGNDPNQTKRTHRVSAQTSMKESIADLRVSLERIEDLTLRVLQLDLPAGACQNLARRVRSAGRTVVRGVYQQIGLSPSAQEGPSRILYRPVAPRADVSEELNDLQVQLYMATLDAKDRLPLGEDRRRLSNMLSDINKLMLSLAEQEASEALFGGPFEITASAAKDVLARLELLRDRLELLNATTVRFVARSKDDRIASELEQTRAHLLTAMRHTVSPADLSRDVRHLGPPTLELIGRLASDASNVSMYPSLDNVLEKIVQICSTKVASNIDDMSELYWAGRRLDDLAGILFKQVSALHLPDSALEVGTFALADYAQVLQRRLRLEAEARSVPLGRGAHPIFSGPSTYAAMPDALEAMVKLLDRMADLATAVQIRPGNQRSIVNLKTQARGLLQTYREAMSVKKTALYWAAKDRRYRATSEECASGTYGCPKCKVGVLRKAIYRRVKGKSEHLYGCPSCMWLISKDALLHPEVT